MKEKLEFGNIYVKRVHLNDNGDFIFLTKRSIKNIQYILNNTQQPTIEISIFNNNKSISANDVNIIDNKYLYLLSNNSIGNIFLKTYTNEDNYKLINKTLEEIYRILKTNGLLFYEGKSIENIQHIENIGLKNIHYTHVQNKNLETENVKAIFIKL